MGRLIKGNFPVGGKDAGSRSVLLPVFFRLLSVEMLE